MRNGIIGIEEFTAITELMKTNAAEKIREALLSLFDRGEMTDI